METKVCTFVSTRAKDAEELCQYEMQLCFAAVLYHLLEVRNEEMYGGKRSLGITVCVNR